MNRLECLIIGLFIPLLVCASGKNDIHKREILKNLRMNLDLFYCFPVYEICGEKIINHKKFSDTIFVWKIIVWVTKLFGIFNNNYKPKLITFVLLVVTFNVLVCHFYYYFSGILFQTEIQNFSYTIVNDNNGIDVLFVSLLIQFFDF